MILVRRPVLPYRAGRFNFVRRQTGDLGLLLLYPDYRNKIRPPKVLLFATKAILFLFIFDECLHLLRRFNSTMEKQFQLSHNGVHICFWRSVDTSLQSTASVNLHQPISRMIFTPFGLSVIGPLGICTCVRLYRLLRISGALR